jgi:hypothetical protein
VWCAADALDVVLECAQVGKRSGVSQCEARSEAVDGHSSVVEVAAGYPRVARFDRGVAAVSFLTFPSTTLLSFWAMMVSRVSSLVVARAETAEAQANDVKVSRYS